MDRFIQLRRIAWILALGLILPGLTLAQGGDLSPAARDLLDTYPGVRVHEAGDRVWFYGRPMGVGEFPELSADAWLTEHGDALGPDVYLELVDAREVRQGKFSVFVYEQRLEGLPVEFGQARVLVLNDVSYPVVYAAADLAQAPDEGFPAVAVDGDDALLKVQALPESRDLSGWSLPELVITRAHDLEDKGALRVWRVSGSNPDPSAARAFTFLVDAATGDVVGVRSDIHHVDVTGTLSGNATPGTLPDVPYNLPVPVGMPQFQVRILGGNSVFTETDGSFVIPHGGSGTVTVQADMVSPWGILDNVAGGEITASASVTPPGPVNLLLNPNPSELTTAQVNALYHTVEVHNFYRERSNFTGIDLQIQVNANLNQNCNAFFSGQDLSINFYTAGGGCVNTAFSSVVWHEYGHFIVNRLNLSQGAFGEGYGDSIGILAFDDPVVGRDWTGPGTWVRNIVAANQQYPCSSGAIHTCGQILGGCWWDTKEALAGTYGNPAALDLVQNLFIAWSDITLGGIDLNSAHPGTVIEVLTVDDNDGNIDNGTPNYSDICTGFSQHNIDCPPLSLITFDFPQGIPDLLTPNVTTVIPVDVLPVAGTPLQGSGEFHYSINGAPFITVSMTETAPNSYEAEVPALPCGDRVRFYFSAQDVGGATQTSPADAPTENYAAVSGSDFIDTFTDDMETDQGWTAGLAGDSATTGVWVRVDPIGTAAQPENDHSNPGTICWVTGQGSVGGSIGENDVDGGLTSLASPVIDLSGGDAKISYWRWYSNDEGASPGTDIFVIRISNSGIGGPWTTVETVGPNTPESSGGWFFHEFWVSDFVVPTANVVMRFNAQDLGSGSIVEASIDDFVVTQVDCGPAGDLFVRGDANADASVSIADVVAVLEELFSGGDVACDDAADTNDDGILDISDAIALLGTLFDGAGPLPPPYPDCGLDPTPDGLGCATPNVCP